MKLENIGFYTLSDERAKKSSETSPLWRCEMILTDLCNFKCAYCRGLQDPFKGTVKADEAMRTLDLWIAQGLKNVRFSGGEPLLYKHLPALVTKAKDGGVERIAISSNGSLPLGWYDRLIERGVNDFSISLDACCAEDGDKAAGGVKGAWDKVIKTIEHLSNKVYTTVGVVLTNENASKVHEIVEFADSLGVSDIRIISAAQTNQVLADAIKIPETLLEKYPILNYRVQNIKSGRHVRGLKSGDSKRCKLVLDDMAVVAGKHFPCIIYLREGGSPIGDVGENMRQERLSWHKAHDTHLDPICSKNCLDVCVDFNNTAEE